MIVSAIMMIVDPLTMLLTYKQWLVVVEKWAAGHHH
jgi:hypothetical protein